MLPFEDGQDNASAVAAIVAGKPVRLRYGALVDSKINFVSGFLYRLLSRYDLGFMSELLLVLVKELTSNCSKANAKRIFFDARKLDPADPEDYDKGIALFGTEVLAEWDAFAAANRGADFYVSILLQKTGDSELSVQIENNVELVPRERNRIEARFASFEKHRSIDRAFAEIRDTSEGAGLGIVMTLLLLQNAGIPPDNFDIKSEAGVTRSTIRLPLEVKPANLRKQFKAQVIQECDSLPSYPQHITDLIELCNSPTVSVQMIAERIQKDPGLTAQILRLVNSAGYMNRNRDPSLTDAVKIIGLKVIRNLLMVTGARNVINSRYRQKELETIWEGSNRVAFFARNLAKTKAVAETAAVAGLLCDLGKIILVSLHPNLVRQIHEMMGSGRIRNSSVIEELSVGIGHPEIGGVMAKKWNFPDMLTTAIEYQQKPLQTPEEHREVVSAVYLATRIQEASLERGDYFSVEPDILADYGIDSPVRFTETVERLTKLYQAEGS